MLARILAAPHCLQGRNRQCLKPQLDRVEWGVHDAQPHLKEWRARQLGPCLGFVVCGYRHVD